MLDAVDEALGFAAALSHDQFVHDRRTVAAVTYEIGVVGEAVAALPEELRERHPDIPWRQIRSMRNRITHQYWAVDPEILWQTVQDDLPLIRSALTQLLADEGEPDD